VKKDVGFFGNGQIYESKISSISYSTLWYIFIGGSGGGVFKNLRFSIRFQQRNMENWVYCIAHGSSRR
jgi:hypothetical protein